MIQVDLPVPHGMLASVPPFSMKYISGHCVLSFSTVELLQRSSPFVFIIEVSQHVDGFIGTTDLRYGHNVQSAELERSDQSQDIIPVWSFFPKFSRCEDMGLNGP